MPTIRNLVLQKGSGAVSQIIEWLTTPTSAEGATLYILLAVLVGISGKFLWGRYSTDEENAVEFADLLDEETLEKGEAERQLLDEIAESHKRVTAPAAVESRAARAKYPRPPPPTPDRLGVFQTKILPQEIVTQRVKHWGRRPSQ